MGKRKYSGNEDTSAKSKTEDIGYEEQPPEEPKDEPAEGAPKPKMSRKSGFDVKHFRKELAAKTAQTTVLTQFLQVCLDPDSEVDIMLEYLKAGGNSHEILRQVSTDSRKNLTLATPAFHIFHLIILKVQASQPHMIAVTEEACRYFLNNFMSTVEIMISENSGPRHRKIILKLLTSMVTLNPDLGIEVLNQAPLTPKHLQHILEKPNYKEKDNVRTAFVHFMTSFLIDGHLPLVKALLEKQGLLSLVIPGLVQDEGTAVLMFLNILKSSVIENPLISKSLKLKTFSHNVLHQMFKVFYWKGPPETSHEEINVYKTDVISLLTNIMLILFTSHKLGLYFTDNFLGTTDANKNQNLYKALLSLKRPWENQSQSEIVLEIVFRCPDLHRAVISLIEQSFEPHHAPIWEKTVDFTMKLYDKLRPEQMVQKFSSLNSLQVANFVRFATLPVPLLKHLQASLAKPDRTMSLYCINVLVKMLSSVKRYLQLLDMANSTAHITELNNKLEYFFPKHLPAPNVIVTLLQDIIKEVNNAKETTQDYKLPTINDADGLIALIDLLLLYNDIHPAHFETLEGNLNMKEILDFASKVSEEHASLLKFKIVSLWLSLDSSAVSLKNPMFKELFHIMLDVYTGEDSTWIDAKETILKFLKSTGIFEADEDEIHIMLHALRNSKVNTAAVGDIVAYVLENIEHLTDYTRGLKADFEIGDAHSEEDLDKLFDKLSQGKEVDSNSFLETKIASPFIAGCVEFVRKNKEAKKSMKQFMSVYVANILHSNYTPQLTVALVSDTKFHAKDYVATWVSEPAALDEATAGKDTILTNISEHIIGDDETQLQDVFPFLLTASSDLHDIAISDAYFKFSEANIDGSELLIWAKYLIFCTIRLANIDAMTESRKEKISTVFEIIMEVGKKKHMIDVCRTILLAMFKNPHFLKVYSPFEKKNNSRVLATDFLLNVVSKYNDTIEFLNKKHKILKAYQKKNYNEASKTLDKMNKKKNIETENVFKVLDTVSMNIADGLQILNKIFQIELAHCVKDDKEPSVVLEVARVILLKYSKSVSLTLQPEPLNQMMTLYTKLLTDKEVTPNLTNIETVLVEYFESKPHQAKFITGDIFKQFFYANTVRKSTAQLSAVLLRFNAKLFAVFKEELDRPEILGQRELTLPLGNALLYHKKLLLDNKDLLSKIFNEYKTNIMKVLEKPHKAGQVYITCWKFIRKLLIECVAIEDCEKLFNKTHKFESVELSHVNLINAVFLKLCLQPERCKKDHVSNYFLSMLNIISLALKDSKDPNVLIDIVTQIYVAAEISSSILPIETIDKVNFQKVIESGIWQNFCKAVLKDSLKLKNEDEKDSSGPKQLFLLTTLTKMFYPEDHDDVTSLFDMATSHSEFLKIMLSYNSPDLKSRLIELLFTLIKLNKNVMKQQQIPVYLSAYGATRSPCDRLILSILHHYEVNGLPVQEYKPYLWGDSAANYYAVRKTRTSTLWSQPTPNQIINLFEKETLIQTLDNFCVNQKLDYDFQLPNIITNNTEVRVFLHNLSQDGIFEPKSDDTETKIRNLTLKSKYERDAYKILEAELTAVSHRKQPGDIYDPAFVFPLLSHMLAPGSTASCFKLLRKGLLSMPVVALSSRCPLMRAAAYHVLHRFHLLLETETKHKNDKILLGDFIDTLRNSLSSAIFDTNQEFQGLKNPGLPAVDALYLAKAIMVSTAPIEPAYKPVTNFLIAKELVDLTVVPDFLALFHDSDVESAERRNWILKIIRNGTRTMVDVHVLFKTMCIKMIMDFYSSVLCDRKGKERILGVLEAIVAIPRAAEIMVEGYGFISWLQAIVKQLGKEDRSLYRSLLKILRSLRESMTVSSFSRVSGLMSHNGKSIVEYPDLQVRKDLEHDILVILYDMLSLTEFVEIDDFVVYLSIFNLLSDKTFKSLNKKDIINFIQKTAGFSKDDDSLKLLTKAASSNNGTDVLNSKVFDTLDSNNVQDNLIVELKTIVYKYVL